MVDQIRTEVAVLGVRAGGRRLTEVSTVSIADTNTRRRGRGSFYALAEPDIWDEPGRNACRIALDALDAALSRDQSLSLTSTLMRAFAAAHDALAHENQRTLPQDRRLIGLSVAALRSDELYIAQAGPALAYIVHHRQLRRIATPSWATWSAIRMGEAEPDELRHSGMVVTTTGNAIGQIALRRPPEPALHHALLEHGDIVLLSTTTLGRVAPDAAVEDVLAGQESLPVALEDIEHIYQNAGAPEEFTAIGISIIDEGVLARPRGAVPDSSYEPVPRPVETGPRPIPFQVARPVRPPDETPGYVEPSYEADPGYTPRSASRHRVPPITIPVERVAATGTDDEALQPRSIPPGTPGNEIPGASAGGRSNYSDRQSPPSRFGHAATTYQGGATRVRPTYPSTSLDYDEADHEEEAEYIDEPATGTPSMTKRMSDFVARLVALASPGKQEPQAYDEEDYTRPRYAGNLPADYDEMEEEQPQPHTRQAGLPLQLPLVLIAIAVILAIVFGTILAVRSLQSNEGSQNPAALLEQARSLESQGMNTKDADQKRTYLNKALADALLAAQGGNAEASDVAKRIQTELDAVNNVVRVQEVISLRDLTSLAANVEPDDIIVNQNNLYLLDRKNGYVLKYLIGANGMLNRADTILFRTGDNLPANLSGAKVEGKIAPIRMLLWMPASQTSGGLKQAFPLALDTQGHLIGYDPARGVFTLQMSPSDAEQRAAGAEDAAGFNGQFYLLDKRLKVAAYKDTVGSVFWAPFSTNGDTGGFNDWALYFAPEVRAQINLDDVTNIAADGSLYLLHSSGKIDRFFGGTQQQPFNAGTPDMPLKNPVQIFTTADMKNVYVLDPANSRIVQYSKDRGDYVRQIRMEDNAILRSARSMYIDEANGKGYAVSGHQIFAFALPK